MLLDFEINPQLDIPIYQQLVDRIRADVRMGNLMPGQQLPTVQEMARQLSIARGTIKRAYDELEHQGVLEKIQGRGTFICYQPENSGSRKERAMAAIDGLLDELESMGFSPMESGIFLSLKQREREQKLSALKIAVVECNSENLSLLTEQLRKIKGVELYAYLLETIQAYPYKLDEDTDLVITTAAHGAYLEGILQESGKLARVAMRLSAQTLAALVQLEAGACVGILSFSGRYGQLMYESCRTYAGRTRLCEPLLFSQEGEISKLLGSADVLLVPRDYERYCSAEVLKMLLQPAQKKKLLCCSYEMDEGSLLHLEQRLEQLRKEQRK